MQETIEQLGAARAAARRGDFEAARGLAAEVLAAYPRSLLALRLLGWAEVELGLDQAAMTFQHCRSQDPLDAMAEIGLALTAEARGQASVALRHFVRAYELNASDQRIRLEIRRLGGELTETALAEGLVALQERHFERAIQHLRAASAAAPDEPAPKLGLAHALWQVGAREQVSNICTALLSTHPHCLSALIYAVAVEVALGRSLRTREMLARVEAIDPGHLLSAPLLQETGISHALQNALRRSGTLI